VKNPTKKKTREILRYYLIPFPEVGEKYEIFSLKLYNI